MKIKKTLAIALLFVAAPSVVSARQPARRSTNAPAPAATQTLPIRRVTIYSNGVAYIERRGTVTGHAEVALPFKQSQMDDALKSMVVLDLGHGTIGAVSYASSEPASARLAEIPFSIAPHTSGSSDVGGIGAVLRQLQGARVTVAVGARAVTGAVLTVEEKTSAATQQQPATTERSLVISTDDGAIESFDLADVRSVRLVDANARRNVAEYADAAAAARRQDANTIVVTSDGTGPRELVVGYTIAAPIWKTTYRVVLDDAGEPLFQGWAIVDNVSEESWTDVDLTLVSGTPISFIQRLQQPFYRRRPEIPIPGDVQLAPQGYEGTVSTGGAGDMSAAQVQNLSMVGRSSLELGRVLPGFVAPSDTLNNSMSVNAQVALLAAHPTLSPAIVTEDSGVSAAATGGEVGDLFEYRVAHPVTVDRNRSALIPIAQTRLKGVRVSLFNPSVNSYRPLGGMRLTNTSSLVFESGPMSIFEGSSYVGDAILNRFKPGEERYVPFSLDLGTAVTVKNASSDGPVFLVRSVQGAIDASYYSVETATYTLRNQTDTPRIVYVEHPRRGGWELLDGAPEVASKTDSVYRFRVMLGPQKVETLTVSERSESHDTFALSDVTSDEVSLLYSRRYIDDASRAALDHIVDVKGKIAALAATLDANEAEVNKIGEDQSRLRDNIEALKQTAEAKSLIARYIAKADAQETRLEQLEAEQKASAAERSRLTAELAIAVRSFAIDRRVSAESGAQ